MYNFDKVIGFPVSNVTCFPFVFQLLLFCEGTRFTDAKHKASMEFAKKNGLPELKHHLLPRTKGFVLSMKGVKGRSKSRLCAALPHRLQKKKKKKGGCACATSMF